MLEAKNSPVIESLSRCDEQSVKLQKSSTCTCQNTSPSGVATSSGPALGRWSFWIRLWMYWLRTSGSESPLTFPSFASFTRYSSPFEFAHCPCLHSNSIIKNTVCAGLEWMGIRKWNLKKPPQTEFKISPLKFSMLLLKLLQLGSQPSVFLFHSFLQRNWFACHLQMETEYVGSVHLQPLQMCSYWPVKSSKEGTVVYYSYLFDHLLL